ncbi:MAG TPA: M20/M25/M40 family metallo-hydrolase [Pirellulales bacterium]|nr:M20/M25/M40 family metallo-hydrolase [Pirellulales bacterium]
MAPKLARPVLAAVLAYLCLVGLAAWPASLLVAAEEKSTAAASAETRLFDSVRYLASDELEGRGVGSQGLNQAADYLAGQFAALGLKTQLFDGGPFQKFSMTTGTELGPVNRAAFVGPTAADKPDGQKIELQLGKDFNPLAIGGSGKLDLPLAFVGYGITGKAEEYDDYAGINVEGKAVIILRHEPEQANPHSVFNGTRHSAHAPFIRKLSNAHEHGAAAVIFCTDDFDIQKTVGQLAKRWQESIDELTAAQAKFKEIEKPTREQLEAHRLEVEKLLDRIRDQGDKLQEEFNPLLGFRDAGPGGESQRAPALYCRRETLDKIVKAACGEDLAALERKIDLDLKPHSLDLKGWRLQGEISVIRQEAEVKNVVAVLEGEGPHADETIVIGAHYDHLGRGGEGSLAPGVKEIHNGADDNASGAAALVEVARRLATREKKLPRRIVFIAFTGEERGLIGSARYCRDPLYPLENTIAMLNMDMVGRLQDDKLVIQGVDTATEFAPLIDGLNERYGFKLTKQPGGFGPSDHASFYAKKVPVMHFFTGTHSDYHRPSDDYDKINLEGMLRVAEMVADTAVQLAEADERPHYLETKPPAAGGGGGDRPYFGSIPDFSQDQPGYALTGVTKGSPAEKAGLKGGDIILQLGESKIGNLEDFDSALRKFKAGDKAPVVVKRGKEELKFEVVLEPPR